MSLSNYTNADDIFSALFALKNAPFTGVNKPALATTELLLMTTFILLQNERFIKTISAFLSVNQTGQWLCSYIAKSQNVRSRNRILLTYFNLLINDIFVALPINNRARSPPAYE